MTLHYTFSDPLTYSTNELSEHTSSTPPVDDHRIFPLNEAPVNLDGDYVLYWMIAHRRTEWNHSLQRAVWWSDFLQKPLVIFEPLRIGYQWASDRHHQWIIDGMKDQAKACSAQNITYYPYIEPAKGEGKGLLKALAQSATVLVTDEYPCFFLPRMVRRASQLVTCRMESVDSNGILPLQKSDRTYTTAASFRRFLQKKILPHFSPEAFPSPQPLTLSSHLAHASIDESIQKNWPQSSLEDFQVSSLDIDHSVYPIEGGGRIAGLAKLAQFVDSKLHRYHRDRNQVDQCAASGLSAHIHFGHISSHEVVQYAFQSCEWHPSQVAPKVSGSRSGWWGAS